MFRGLVLALVASVAISGSAFAGSNSGGAKKDATIKVNNDATLTYVCVIDASNNLKSKLAAGTATLADLNAEGGKILQPGKVGHYKVRAGTHRIGIAVIDNAGNIDDETVREVSRSVGKGRTLEVLISSIIR